MLQDSTILESAGSDGLWSKKKLELVTFFDTLAGDFLRSKIDVGA